MSDRILIHAEVERFWESLSKLCKSEAHRLAMLEWCEFLGAQWGTLQGADKLKRAELLQAEAYLEWQYEQPGLRGHTRRPGTIANRIAKIRYILKRMQHMGFVSQNVFYLITAPNAQRDQTCKPPALSLEDVGTIFANFKDTEKERRNRAIFALFFGAGMRVSEVQRLDMGDLRRHQSGIPYLKLRRTKSGPDQTQVIAPAFHGYILDYYQERIKHEFVTPKSPFWSRRIFDNRRLCLNAFDKIFRRHVERCGITASTHSGRHTAINTLFNSGLSTEQVQEFSRHTNILSLNAYKRDSIGIVESAANQLNYGKP